MHKGFSGLLQTAMKHNEKKLCYAFPNLYRSPIFHIGFRKNLGDGQISEISVNLQKLVIFLQYCCFDKLFLQVTAKKYLFHVNLDIPNHNIIIIICFINYFQNRASIDVREGIRQEFFIMLHGCLKQT